MAPQIGSAGEARGQQRSQIHTDWLCVREDEGEEGEDEDEGEEGDDGPGMLKYGHTVQLSKVFLCCTLILLLKEPCRQFAAVVYPERGFF